MIRERLSAYIKYFIKCRNVLDLGCGRGEMLGLLKESNIPAIGVDSDPESIKICKQSGLKVIDQDVFDFLKSNRGFDGIMASQLIEHLDNSRAERLIGLCHEVLEPGGIMIIITPNPENLTAITKTFWLDPTHVRPYPLELLTELSRSAGFEILSAGDALNTRPGGIRTTLERNFWGPLMDMVGLSQLRRHLYSGHDIYVVARKP